MAPHAGPFDYFRNSWNVVGLKDYLSGHRVAPDNSILLAGKNVLRFRFGQDLTPLSRRQTKTALEGWLPVMRLSAWDGAVRYDFQFWATPLPTVKDWQRAFDWPTEGENFLVWAMVNATNTGAAGRGETIGRAVRSRGGQAPRVLLAAGGRRPVPRPSFGRPLPRLRTLPCFDRADPKLWLQRTVDYWKKRCLAARRIEVPCRKATDALLAAHVCQLIASDHGELHGGEGFYDISTSATAAIRSWNSRRPAWPTWPPRPSSPFSACQRPDGRFESQAE